MKKVDISEVTSELEVAAAELLKKMQGSKINPGFDVPEGITVEVQRNFWSKGGHDRCYFNIVFTTEGRYQHSYKFNAGYIDCLRERYCVDSRTEINLAKKDFTPAIEKIEKIYIAPEPEPKQTITVDGKEYEFRHKIDGFEVLKDKLWTDSEGRLFVAIESSDKSTGRPYSIVCVKPGEKYVLGSIE